MAESKILLTRIVNKHDSLDNWNNSNLVLKEGEIALAKVITTKPDGHGGHYQVPTFLMKVGVEGKKFSELNWLSAPASDVYAWAKNVNAEDVSVKASGATTGKTLALWFKDLQDADAGLASDIADLEELVGTTPVVSQITAAINALDVDTWKNEDGIKFVTAIGETNGKISVTRRVLTKADIPNIDIAQVTGLQSALDLKATIAYVNSEVATEKTNREDADENLQDQIDTINETILALEGTTHFIGVKTSLPSTANKGDVVIVGNKEYIYSPDSTTDTDRWIELGDTSAELQRIADIEATLNSYSKTSTVKAAIAAVVADHAEDVADLQSKINDKTAIATHNALAQRVTTAEGKITNLEARYTDAQVDSAITTKVNALANGQVKTNTQEISSVKSDLSEYKAEIADRFGDAETILIFDCGTATTVI